MPRVGQAYYLTGANAHTQLTTGAGNTVQSLVLEGSCSALLLSARTGSAYITFDNSTPASTNGLELQAAAQPILIPLGYNMNNSHTLKVIGSAASTILNVVQLN